MALYRRLSARFHCTPDELALRREAIDTKLNELDQNEADLLGLDQPLAKAWKSLKLAAGQLTTARCKLADEFARVIQKRLKPLGLGGSRLTVEVETRALGDDPSAASPSESGADRVEILFSANPGEEPRPLRMIASGGELSRLTLAAKTVLAAVDRVPTLIFDEIDTGVGGRLGSVTGQGTRRAGSPPSGHLRDSSSPDGQLRASPVGYPQANRTRPVADHHHAPGRGRADQGARGHAPRRFGG